MNKLVMWLKKRKLRGPKQNKLTDFDTRVVTNAAKGLPTVMFISPGTNKASAELMLSVVMLYREAKAKLPYVKVTIELVDIDEVLEETLGDQEAS